MKNHFQEFSSLPGTESSKNTIDSLSKVQNSCFEENKIRRVLGIDPGLANTGFGVVDCFKNRYRMVSYGVIETPSDSPHSNRLLAIYSRIQAVIDEFRPTEASMESLFFAKNVTSAMNVAEAKGVVMLALAQNVVPLSEYKPNQIKKAVTGSAAADKELVEKYVKLLLNLKTEPKPDHASDALACALTHLHYTA